MFGKTQNSLTLLGSPRRGQRKAKLKLGENPSSSGGGKQHAENWEYRGGFEGEEKLNR